MASFTQDLRAALNGKTQSVPSIPATFYDQSSGGLPAIDVNHVRVQLIPASQRPRAIAGGRFEHEGVYRVALYYQPGVGTGAAEAMGDAVRDTFKPPCRIPTAGGERVRIEYAERAEPIEDGPHWLIIPVTIQWRCFSIRA